MMGGSAVPVAIPICWESCAHILFQCIESNPGD